ncbi:MAG: cyclically-permuted mutarotase family protein [Muribaculaceae bacterium]
MKIQHIALYLALALVAVACRQQPQVAALSGFPHQEPGYEQGVSACYAAVIGNELVMAGGANFAQVPAAEGGTKCYYGGIYAASLNADSLLWRQVGTLPAPAAYGVTLATPDSLIVAGGITPEGAQNTVYSIAMRDGKAVVHPLPALPQTIDNAAGCVADGVAYVVGGNANGAPSAQVYALNLKQPAQGWRAIATMPQPRVQPVCTAVDGTLYVWGGFTPVTPGNEPVVHTGGLALDLSNNTWQQMPAPTSPQGDELTLSGACAIARGGCIVATGGVNRQIFLDAISGAYKLIAPEDYLLQEPAWYKFNALLLSFDCEKQQWTVLGSYEPLARAGAALAIDRTGVIYNIGGETKPGIRAPQITEIRL